jgi:hypothetical protein
MRESQFAATPSSFFFSSADNDAWTAITSGAILAPAWVTVKDWVIVDSGVAGVLYYIQCRLPTEGALAKSMSRKVFIELSRNGKEWHVNCIIN